MTTRLNRFANRATLAVLTSFLVALLVGGQTTAHGEESQAYFQTHFQDESQFIVESILTDIAEMAYCAKNHAPPAVGKVTVAATETPDSPFGAPKYEISITLPGKALKAKLEVNGPIWSPEIYAAITRQLFSSLGLEAPPKPSVDPNDIEMLRALLDLKATNVEVENQKLSKLLDTNFSDPALHQRAAALMGTFALRESSGDFFDIRSSLCRITAHLAMAQGLARSAAYGPNGQLAEVLLYTLMNNEKDAITKAAAMDQKQPVLAAWSRALYARNTHDYRTLATTKNRSLLETLEYFRAFAWSVDTSIGWEKLTEAQPTPLPDPVRFALDHEPSIQLGHALLALSLPLEHQEEVSVYHLSQGALDQQHLLAALNQPPERCFSYPESGPPQTRVIGWGQWAMFCQRHLCHVIEQDFNFLDDSLGVRRDAGDFAYKCDVALSGLRLYPFVQRFTCKDEASYRAAIDAAFPVTRSTPELVPAEAWNYLSYKPSFAKLYAHDPGPHINEWHKHNPPPGTAYDTFPRMDHPSLVRRADTLALLAGLHARAPYDREIAHQVIFQTYKGHASLEKVKELYQPILDYDIHAMYRVATCLSNNPAAYEELMAKASALYPAYYFHLGKFLAGKGDSDKAAGYMQRGADLCKDEVYVASEADWLVKYYFGKGQVEKANSFADRAAKTYSYRGLLTKADLLESMGNYTEALDWHKKIEERYNDSSTVVCFCERYKRKTGKSDFDQTLLRRVTDTFPKGLERVDLAAFTQPPADGALITDTNNETDKAGLKKGDVIVAVYGIRVHNFGQYVYARKMSDAPALELVVWQDNKFRDLKASPPNHQFGVAHMGDYLAK